MNPNNDIFRIPNIRFKANNTFDLIEEIENNRFNSLFDYQYTRELYSLLLNFIIKYAPKNSFFFNQKFLNLFKNHERPYIIWYLYRTISKISPEVIPFLISDSDITPIAYKQLDFTELNESILSEQIDNNKKFKEKNEIINILYSELFDITLEQMSYHRTDSKEEGKLLSKILIDISKKLFIFRHNNQYCLISHNIFKDRYYNIIRKIEYKRIDNIYTPSNIKPRLIYFIAQDLFSFFKNECTKQKTLLNEYLEFDSAFIDLGIKILQLTSLRTKENEISNVLEETIKNLKNEIVSFLQDYIENYYSINEIDVQVYNPTKLEKRKIIRGFNEFGFEIIDWGYLYLNFYQNKIISIIDDNFKSSLDFDNNEDKYFYQNKNQFEKLKLYLMGLMLSYIEINAKKNYYEMAGFQVRETLLEFRKFNQILFFKIFRR